MTPAHSLYTSPVSRKRSFKDWPRNMSQKPEDLVEAGFFYNGLGDKVICFYCGGGLKDWNPEDVPWEEHARWFRQCAYVQQVKGKDYIQRVISEACALPASYNKPPPSPQSTLESKIKPKDETETPKNTDLLCKICYDVECNICFMPCGHVVACGKCALSLTRCPLCRRVYLNAVRIYFS